jgi:hypothetical protein
MAAGVGILKEVGRGLTLPGFRPTYQLQQRSGVRKGLDAGAHPSSR